MTIEPITTRYTFFIDEPLCRPAGGEPAVAGGLALLTRSVDIELRDRKSGLWSVAVDGGVVLNKDGETEYEPLPSSRGDGFLARTRFPLGEAIALARAFIGHHERYEP